MSTITVKDLTKDYPRSPLTQLGGYPWLARLIDKVRALHAGKIGEYTPFPCGGDRNFIGTVGVDAEPLGELIKGGATDDEVVAWVKAHQTPGAAERLAAYAANQKQPIQDPTYLGYLAEAKAELHAARPELDLSAVDNFTRLICIEEGHPMP